MYITLLYSINCKINKTYTHAVRYIGVQITKLNIKYEIQMQLGRITYSFYNNLVLIL